MKKVIFALTLLSAVSLVSCGPSEEELKELEKQMLDATKSVDSLFKNAEQSIDTTTVAPDTTAK
ncbi:MAG: hypothetical protein IT233_00075 [Bacteroidia bacterium]|nr:hypothetical protein [Bacteroidia bacterium]